MAYSVDQLRKARDKKENPTDELASIPLDAPFETEDAIGFWNGRAFVSWEEWVMRHPVGVSNK